MWQINTIIPAVQHSIEENYHIANIILAPNNSNFTISVAFYNPANLNLNLDALKLAFLDGLF